MFDLPLTDFVLDDFTVEYTEEFKLEACYKNVCNSTFVYIKDNDCECYGSCHPITIYMSVSVHACMFSIQMLKYYQANWSMSTMSLIQKCSSVLTSLLIVVMIYSVLLILMSQFC